MHVETAVAPSLEALRPLLPTRGPRFPVYQDLAAHLVRPLELPDATVAHVLAVAAGYAYSDAVTMATMLARMGLEGNRCRTVALTVDAMLIESTAYVIQSEDGSVVIVAYRGTQPANLVNWLTDADIRPDRIAFPFPDGETSAVHAGFYRNVRATRFAVVEALLAASEGRSILDGTPVTGPMRALYVTGHSLGGAMATVLTVMLATVPEYVERFGPAFRGASTYGAPMVGDPAFAARCAAHPLLGDHLLRYSYRRDPVPHLPPKDADRFAHFGREFSFDGGYPWTESTAHPAGQLGFVAELLGAAVGFVADQLRPLRALPLPYSWNDHLPHHYISALTPPGVANEFGDELLVSES